MIASLFLSTALAILPSDRMGMADRLFDRGAYEDAKKEYLSLSGCAEIREDELLYRLAECARLLKDVKTARATYRDLIARFPLSRHAARAQLMYALTGSREEQCAELKLLDRESVEAPLRARALYHLGVVAHDRAAFERCMTLDPTGPYAAHAKFHHASLLAKDEDPAQRRKAIGEWMDLHLDKTSELSRDALALAATHSYREKRYGEASTLFRRYLKLYPGDAREETSRVMAAWSDYLRGQYTDAIVLCGAGDNDDTAYLLSACAYAMNDKEKARARMTAYLERFPTGRYRATVELPLARMDFEDAEKASDVNKMVESAKRLVALSKTSADRLRLAWAYEKGEQTAEAQAEYLAIARDFPQTDNAAEALFRKAMIDVRAEKWSPAELALAEAIASNKNLARQGEAFYWRGIAAHQLGHEEKAISFLNEALKAKGLSLDETREAQLLLADADFKAGRIKEAKAAYQKLVREGACDRMRAAKMHSVGCFLLDCREGETAFAEAKMCAQALLAQADSPEWRQAAYALKGAIEEASGETTAAIESYRHAAAEKVRLEEMRTVMLALGILESKAGFHADAMRSLKEAVTLNANATRARAQAYLWLARTCEAMADARGACAYATVVLTLFDDALLAAEAKKILEAHPEEAK